MKIITTCSDYKYLRQGIAMCESVFKHSDDVTIHYLCLDEETYANLQNIPNVVKYRVRDMGYNNTLTKYKLNNYKYFCWCCASFFTKFIMSKVKTNVTYVDADIYFYKSIDFLYDAFGDSDVGLFRHRQWPLEEEHIEGSFNVGVVYFAYSGKHILDWWANAVLYKLYPKYATCGDQKYLDYFQEMTDNIYIDTGIGHGAPWQWQVHDLTLLHRGFIGYQGESQPFVFNHFSQFQYTKEDYVPSSAHHVYSDNNKIFEHPELKRMYDEYHEKLISISL